MKLIDADALITALCEQETELAKCGIMLVKGEHNLFNIIKEQPTAYDVDKVVDELESADYPYYLFDEDGYEINESLLMAGMVEDIVRRGGIND